eukprot:6832300-Prymnesium_polylepis.1
MPTVDRLSHLLQPLLSATGASDAAGGADAADDDAADDDAAGWLRALKAQLARREAAFAKWEQQ